MQKAAEIREVPDRDLDSYIRIQLDAYPGLGMVYERDREKLRERLMERKSDRRVTLYGSYREGRLIGCMRVHDYRMSYRGDAVSAGGLGGVAVDLACKREGVAGEMVQFYLDRYHAAGAPMAVLWPFRPDFYRKMGFGYGGKKYRYALLPQVLPKGGSKEHITHAGEKDYAAMVRCYERVREGRTGMMDETEQTMRGTIGAATGGHAVIYRDGREVRGFMIYRFRRGVEANFVSNDLHVEECLYEDPEVLEEFLSFLHAQRDQVRRVIMDLPDSDFHYVPTDPRNGSDNLYPSVYHEVAACAVGAMYRVLDVNRLFTSAPGAGYGTGEITATFKVADRWWGKTAGETTVAFCDGEAQVVTGGRANVVIELDVAEFSSLVTGAVRLSRLLEYGLAQVNKPELAGTLDAVLATRREPYCFSRF